MDGVLQVVTGSDTSAVTFVDFAVTNNVFIGALNLGGYYRGFSGVIDNTMIYDRGLSEEEVVAIYEVQGKD